jgi:hypothetical protein
MMSLLKMTEQNIHVDIEVEYIMIFGLFLTSVCDRELEPASPALQAGIRDAIKHRQLPCREAPPCGRVASKFPEVRSRKIILTRNFGDYIA